MKIEPEDKENNDNLELFSRIESDSWDVFPMLMFDFEDDIEVKLSNKKND